MKPTKCMDNCGKLHWQGKQEGSKIGKVNRNIQLYWHLFFMSAKYAVYVANIKILMILVTITETYLENGIYDECGISGRRFAKVCWGSSLFSSRPEVSIDSMAVGQLSIEDSNRPWMKQTQSSWKQTGSPVCLSLTLKYRWLVVVVVVVWGKLTFTVIHTCTCPRNWGLCFKGSSRAQGIGNPATMKRCHLAIISSPGCSFVYIFRVLVHLQSRLVVVLPLSYISYPFYTLTVS